MRYIDVADLMARISLAGPVLYVGLSMALNPPGFVASLQKLARVLHERMSAFYPSDLQLGPPQPASTRLCNALRFTGVWLILGAFLHLAGFLN